jgi:hypothetical protein
LRARRAGALQIAGDIADNWIELRHGNSQTIGGTCVHGDGLAPDRPFRQWPRRHSYRLEAPIGRACDQTTTLRPGYFSDP